MIFEFFDRGDLEASPGVFEKIAESARAPAEDQNWSPGCQVFEDLGRHDAGFSRASPMKEQQNVASALCTDGLFVGTPGNEFDKVFDSVLLRHRLNPWLVFDEKANPEAVSWQSAAPDQISGSLEEERGIASPLVVGAGVGDGENLRQRLARIDQVRVESIEDCVGRHAGMEDLQFLFERFRNGHQGVGLAKGSLLMVPVKRTSPPRCCRETVVGPQVAQIGDPRETGGAFDPPAGDVD